MEELLWIGMAIGAGFTAIILPWINHTRLNQLHQEIRRLKAGAPAFSPVTVAATLSPATAPAAIKPMAPPPTAAPLPKPAAPQPKKKHRNFEQQFGQRLPVWIGAIALALGGYFLVRYSIEHILTSPLLRIIGGMALGSGLVYAAAKLREKSVASGTRIAQAMSGAGIAVLYITIFAATSRYHILPEIIGFLGMGGVTALAVVLSLRHGSPIALIGLLGGLLTPALIASNAPSAPLLFLYLYMVFAGLMLVVRRERWWWLSLPTLAGMFFWTILWIAGRNFASDDGLVVSLFLLAISSTIVAVSPRQESASRFSCSRLLEYAGLGGALLLTALIVGKSGFELFEWGLLGLLSLSGIGLAFFNTRLYGFVPATALALNLIMLNVWHGPDVGEYILVISGFALLFTGSGYLLMRRATDPLRWALLGAGAATAYYLSGYHMLHTKIHLESLPLLWGTIAVLLAAVATYAASEVKEYFRDHPKGNLLLAVYATAATAFIALALGIELKREFLSVAIAAEMLSLAWIQHRLALPVLRPLVTALALVFGILLMPQITLLTQLTAYSIVEAKLYLQDSVPIVAWPTFQLGLPAAMFLLAGWLLRQTQDGRLVRALEYTALALLATMGYYLMRHTFHVDADVLFVKAGFFERGVITNTLFAYGIGCLVIGRLRHRRAFSLSGVGLTAAALFRIVYFDMLSYNPAFAVQEVAGVTLFNTLLLPFGAPLLWATLAAREIHPLAFPRLSHWVSATRLPMLFCLLSLNVRFLFHGGSAMHEDLTPNAEIYCYSVVWLLLGIGLLVSGTLHKNRLLRVSSLLVMILTVCKVFLYDASELEGLYRVFSFLGLGACLLGLSWFYTRFVFTGKDAEENV